MPGRDRMQSTHDAHRTGTVHRDGVRRRLDIENSYTLVAPLMPSRKTAAPPGRLQRGITDCGIAREGRSRELSARRARGARSMFRRRDACDLRFQSDVRADSRRRTELASCSGTNGCSASDAQRSRTLYDHRLRRRPDAANGYQLSPYHAPLGPRRRRPATSTTLAEQVGCSLPITTWLVPKASDCLFILAPPSVRVMCAGMRVRHERGRDRQRPDALRCCEPPSASRWPDLPCAAEPSHLTFRPRVPGAARPSQVR